MPAYRTAYRQAWRSSHRPLIGGRKQGFHPDFIAYAEAVGLPPTDPVLAGSSELVNYLYGQDLLSSACFLPLKDSAGIEARVIGGLTSGSFTLRNGEPWVSGGGITLNGTTQYLDKGDFLGGGESLAVFTAAKVATSGSGVLAGQYDFGNNQRSFLSRLNSGALETFYSDDGSNVDRWQANTATADGLKAVYGSTYSEATKALENYVNGLIADSTYVNNGATNSKLNTSVLVTIGANLNSGTASDLITAEINAQLWIEGADLTSAQITNISTLLNNV